MSRLIRGAVPVLVLALLLALPWLSPRPYLIHLAVQALIMAMVAQGLNVIQGQTGYVSIVQGGLMGVGAYTSAILSLKAGWPVWPSMLVAPLVTALLALVIGLPTLRVRGHYFAIITLAYGVVIFTVLLNWAGLTGGEAGLARIPKPEAIPLPGGDMISFRNRANYYYVLLAVAAGGWLFARAVMRSRIGRVLGSIRQNETLAEAAGIACRPYKLFAFAVSAAYAGIAGAFYAHYMGFINPTPFSTETALNAILAIIIGGSGTLSGPAVGAFIVTFLPEYLRIDETHRMIAYGLILIVATIWMPRGLVPALRQLAERIARRSRLPEAAVERAQ